MISTKLPRLLSVSLAALAVSAAQAQSEPFYPNDPYFFPGAEGVAAGYYGQWHLVNQMPVVAGVNAGLDVNILGAWQKGYTGKGVIIGVIDDSVQGSHPDLDFYNAYSWDFGQDRAANLASDYRGSPMNPTDNHGTAVAGVAAGIGGNGIGGTGAAGGAGVAGVRLIGVSNVTAQMHAAAILYQGQLGSDGLPDPLAAHDWSTGVPVKVKNHSYGIPVSYARQDSIISDAYRESLSHGVIHVMSSGNEREPSDNGWSNGFDSGKKYSQSQPGIIIVAALGSDGKYSDYSSYGSNVFVTAPSNSGGMYGIATSDRTGVDGYNLTEDGPDKYFAQGEGSAPDVLNYTSTFGGTSSSSPLVAGIMALGVEANPNLNGRMAQHILARTSRVVDANDSTRIGGWVTNSAGYHFNRNYGFGLIDATAFVNMAEQGGSVSEQTYYESGKMQVSSNFWDKGNTITYLHDVQIAPELLQPIEFISVYFLITGLQTDLDAYMNGIGTIGGDIEAWLISPDGTRQMLFSDDRMIPESDTGDRYHDSDFIEWEFISYAYWGEIPEGIWTVELINNSENPLTGVWQDVGFTIGMGEYLIPEPQTYALVLGIAAAGVLLLRRRSRRMAAN